MSHPPTINVTLPIGILKRLLDDPQDPKAVEWATKSMDHARAWHEPRPATLQERPY